LNQDLSDTNKICNISKSYKSWNEYYNYNFCDSDLLVFDAHIKKYLNIIKNRYVNKALIIFQLGFWESILRQGYEIEYALKKKGNLKLLLNAIDKFIEYPVIEEIDENMREIKKTMINTGLENKAKLLVSLDKIHKSKNKIAFSSEDYDELKVYFYFDFIDTDIRQKNPDVKNLIGHLKKNRFDEITTDFINNGSASFYYSPEMIHEIEDVLHLTIPQSLKIIQKIGSIEQYRKNQKFDIANIKMDRLENEIIDAADKLRFQKEEYYNECIALAHLKIIYSKLNDFLATKLNQDADNHPEIIEYIDKIIKSYSDWKLKYLKIIDLNNYKFFNNLNNIVEQEISILDCYKIYFQDDNGSPKFVEHFITPFNDQIIAICDNLNNIPMKIELLNVLYNIKLSLAKLSIKKNNFDGNSHIIMNKFIDEINFKISEYEKLPEIQNDFITSKTDDNILLMKLYFYKGEMYRFYAKNQVKSSESKFFYSEALTAYSFAERYINYHFFPFDVWKIFARKAEIYKITTNNKSDFIKQELLRAVDEIDYLRKNFATSYGRMTLYNQDFEKVFEDLIFYIVENSEGNNIQATALHYVEKAKAQTFYEMLSSNASYSEELTDKYFENNLSDLARQEIKHPLQIQHELFDDTERLGNENCAIIEYYYTSYQKSDYKETDYLYCWVINKDNISFEKKIINTIKDEKNNNELEQLLTKNFEDLIRNENILKRDTINKLSNLLIPNILLNTNMHLCIIPYKNLHYFPFMVLKVNDKQYIFEKYSLSYSLSFNLLSNSIIKETEPYSICQSDSLLVLVNDISKFQQRNGHLYKLLTKKYKGIFNETADFRNIKGPCFIYAHAEPDKLGKLVIKLKKDIKFEDYYNSRNSIPIIIFSSCSSGKPQIDKIIGDEFLSISLLMHLSQTKLIFSSLEDSVFDEGKKNFFYKLFSNKEKNLNIGKLIKKVINTLLYDDKSQFNRVWPFIIYGDWRINISQ